MPEDEAQDAALVAEPSGRGAGDDDALRVDHLAHHAAGAVRGGHEHRAHADLLSGDGLQVAEEHIASRVAAGQSHAQPAEQRAEEGVEPAGLRQREAERRIHAGVAGEKAEREHRGDGEEGEPQLHQRFAEELQQSQRREAHQQPRDDRHEQDARARAGEQVDLEDRVLRLRIRERDRRGAQHRLMQAGHLHLKQ